MELIERLPAHKLCRKYIDRELDADIEAEEFDNIMCAVELNAEVILMAKNGVNGVYSSDPRKNKDAIRYEEITYMDIINKKLEVMDSTAVSLCMDNHMPLFVFNMNVEGNILKAVQQDMSIGTLIK